MLREAFRAMGTDVLVLADGPDRPFRAAAASVRDTFGREERRFSRFLAESELSRVNRSAGRWVRISREMAEVVGLALEGAARTGGLFDPTVLPALLAAGYDRDLHEVLAAPHPAVPPPTAGGRWTEVELRGRTLRLAPGVALDLGGIAKGWTVDRAAERALAAGLPWVLVDAGGDLRVAGEAPPLPVAVEDPHRPGHELLRLVLERGALATSSVARRSWGEGLHHLVDPRTGLPATTATVQATAWAPTCAEAEIRATWALLEGPAAATRFPAAIITGGSVTLSMEAAA
jgi:thiamine biosynthesis lipoprotein